MPSRLRIGRSICLPSGLLEDAVSGIGAIHEGRAAHTR